jgi:hypothetical protein
LLCSGLLKHVSAATDILTTVRHWSVMKLYEERQQGTQHDSKGHETEKYGHESGTKYDCAVEGQQPFTRPTRLGPFSMETLGRVSVI